MPRNRIALLLWTVALGATVRSAHAEILAQVVPVKYSLTATPGKPIARDVMIVNRGAETVVVKVRLSDWTLSEEGQLNLAPVGSTPASLAGMVRFEPEEFSLGAGQSGTIHVSLLMPGDGPATRWGVLLSEIRPAVPKPASFGPRAIAELGTTLYLSRTPADLIRPQVTGLDVRSVGTDSIAVTLRVRNNGDRHFYVTGDLAVSDSSRATVLKGPLGTGVVLPGALRSFTWMSAAGLRPGPYAVTATLDTGEPELIVGEASFVWPLPRPVALPLAEQR